MSSVYADVIVDITNEKLDRTFQYKVPPELTGEIGPGTAVQIPFGNGNRTITGYVLSVGNEPKYPQDRMKAILAVQKDAATVETKLIALAAWMRHTYGSTMIQALKTVLPVKVKARGKETREIALLADPAECEELLENYRKKNYKARIRLLNALLAGSSRAGCEQGTENHGRYAARDGRAGRVGNPPYEHLEKSGI